MNEKITSELEKILENTHVKNIPEYLQLLDEHKEKLTDTDKPFAEYMRKVIQKKKLKKQDIFLWADIPERYGYKLLTEEKRTRQRDIILRICYAAEFTLEETQMALKKYEMPQLYAKIPRDAILMICFNERPGTVLDINALLKENGMEQLRTSGAI